MGEQQEQVGWRSMGEQQEQVEWRSMGDFFFFFFFFGSVAGIAPCVLRCNTIIVARRRFGDCFFEDFRWFCHCGDLFLDQWLKTVREGYRKEVGLSLVAISVVVLGVNWKLG